MIKAGQIYKEKELPYWRKHECNVFVISSIDFTACIIYKDGTVYRGIGIKWIKEDCKLIAEYPTWQEAVNSKEFRDE